MGVYKKLKIKMPIIYGRRFAHYIGEVIQIEEIWKPIKNYEGLYEVSNLGRIKGVTRYVKGKVGYRIQKEKIRKCEVSSNGYLHVLLCKNGKYTTHNVHRLVAGAFIPNPDNLPEINHKDENKENNCVDNLEWCTRKYNMNYGTTQSRIHNKYWMLNQQ